MDWFVDYETEHWCGKCNSVIKTGEMYAFMWREVENKIKKFPVHKECLEEWERANS